MADKYEFLSDEWIDAARKIREEMPPGAGAPPHVMKMNLVVTDVPHKDGGSVDAHLDTSDGELKMDVGHLEAPDLTVTVDFDTAKAIIVEQNAQAGMQAFMAGKVKVQGDMTKLMAMQAQTPDPAAAEVAEKIKAITA